MLKQYIQILASESTTFSKDFSILAEFLYSYLPKLAKERYNYSYSLAKYKLVFKTTYHKSLIIGLKACLQDKGFLTPNVKRSFAPLLKKTITLEEIADLLVKLYKEKFHISLENTKEKAIFMAFYRIFREKEKTGDMRLLYVARRFLESRNLRNLIKTIKAEELDVKQVYKETESQFINLSKKLFKLRGTNPTKIQLARLKTKSIEIFKEWSVLNIATKILRKENLEEAWESEGFNSIEDIAKVKRLTASLKIPFKIHNKFRGKLGLGDTTALFKYYSIYGDLLNAVPNSDVIMNKNYDPEAYDSKKHKGKLLYCSHKVKKPGESREDYMNKKRQPIYTIKQSPQARSKAKFTNIAKLRETIVEVRNNYSRDIVNTKILPKFRMAALVLSLVDTVQARIGTEASEKKSGALGMVTLKRENIRYLIKTKSIYIKYIGKDNVEHNHKISDPKIVRELRKLMRGKDKKDNLFSMIDKEKKVTLRYKNMKEYFDTIGFEGSARDLRNLHATDKFNSILDKTKKEAIKGKKFTENQVLKQFNKTLEDIGKMLGHTTELMGMQAYIDPLAIYEFFKITGIDIPKKFIKILKDRGVDIPKIYKRK